MDIDARDCTVRAGDMKFPGGLGIMLVQICALHALLYNESGPVKDRQADDFLIRFGGAYIKEI